MRALLPGVALTALRVVPYPGDHGQDWDNFVRGTPSAEWLPRPPQTSTERTKDSERKKKRQRAAALRRPSVGESEVAEIVRSDAAFARFKRTLGLIAHEPSEPSEGICHALEFRVFQQLIIEKAPELLAREFLAKMRDHSRVGDPPSVCRAVP